MKYIQYTALSGILALAIIGCKKIESLPDEPHIEFRSFTVFDTINTNLGREYKAGRLKIYFEDGDGDMGLYPKVYDTDDTINMFLNIFRKTRNQFIKITDSSDPLFPSGYRIPYMDRIGQNKILRGTIYVTIPYFDYDPIDTDTIKYEFFIMDRMHHSSDTLTTPEIALSVNNEYF